MSSETILFAFPSCLQKPRRAIPFYYSVCHSAIICIIGASGSEPHTSVFNCNFSYIMAYGSTPYVGMVRKKMPATLKVRKWHTRNVDVGLVKGFHEHYQALSSASVSNGTIRCAGEHRWSTRPAENFLWLVIYLSCIVLYIFDAVIQCDSRRPHADRK